MKKSINILMLVLIAQCLILASILFTSGQQANNSPEKLLNLDFTSIDSLTLSDENGELEVLKKDNTWQLPNYGELAVKTDRIEEVLQELEAIEVSWPVASTDDAAKRFEVSMENAQKSLKLKSGQEILAKLYIGTSPGYRKVHVRRGDDKDIYAVELSQYRLSSKGQDWFDKNILAYRSDLRSVTVGDITFNRVAEQWQLENDEASQLDQDKISSWVKTFSTLSVINLVDEQLKPAIFSRSPEVVIALDGEAGSSVLELRSQEDTFYINKQGDSKIFEIARYQVESVSQFDLKDYLQAATPAIEDDVDAAATSASVPSNQNE